MKRIPEAGVLGEANLKEAAAGELEDVITLVRYAIEQHYKRNERGAPYIYIHAIYPDRVIIKLDARYLQHFYSLDDSNQVILGDAAEVTREFSPVFKPSGAFLEAVAGEVGGGSKYLIRVIKAGKSHNNAFYPDSTLREATPMFEGVRVFVKSDAEHLAGKGKSFNQLIGKLTEPRFIEGAKTNSGEIQANLDLLDSAGDVSAKLREAVERGMADLFGFSIDVTAKTKKRGRLREATQFTKIHSLDLIIEPGAGGEVIQLLEAVNHQEVAEMALRERMIEAVKAHNKGSLPDGLDIDDDEKLEAAYREAIAEPAEKAAGAIDPAAVPAAVEIRIRMIEARAETSVLLAESGLPVPVKDKLAKQFKAQDDYAIERVVEAISEEKEVLARMTESGHVSGLGEGRVESGEDRSEKVSKMFAAFFDPDNREVQSFKECYIDITGDKRVTGHLRDCDMSRMRESVGGEAAFREAISSSTFSNVLGDSITRAMIADYRETGQYDVWRQLATTVPANDFRTQERTRMGGYGDLPAVAENGAYGALTSPNDEKATYAVTKKGGTETISLETIKNDDVGVVMRIPRKLSRAAKRTLSKFVLDFLRTNPAIYDAVALFHATHNNLGAAALSSASLAAARLAMLQQTELDSGDRLGIGPQNLWVPADLEEAAVNLFNRGTENDKTFLQTLALNIIPVWYWTDTNDWVVSADKLDIPTIELAFLDGQEEPELFVQDNPTQGSLFSNDQIKYKIRHIYGGNVLDYRGMYKGVVV